MWGRQNPLTQVFICFNCSAVNVLSEFVAFVEDETKTIDKNNVQSSIMDWTESTALVKYLDKMAICVD